jgi:hypothetical protein
MQAGGVSLMTMLDLNCALICVPEGTVGRSKEDDREA